ncbi:aldehyde dehydrogenase (NADP(+)) [Aeromicrobium phragmitis]|uniref:Aldehyde dehydrogenase (NADP(+)) n=1 Tax=Aeromicrobium phragmitis TaxID=2478914 RepID=A0A3L8PHI7_9ACTN|nr:aldehyde dehydrogenase (NADP(+)) [Aeromicrobium phragmitis]RLV54564.1 aldehyde dehydrogenase (NADP(+)) [Aeromicrobium phragmitis]
MSSMTTVLRGESFLGGERRRGSSSTRLRSRDPRTGEELDPEYAAADFRDIAEVCAAAARAFVAYRAVPVERRAQFLRAIAEEIERDAAQIVARGAQETGFASGKLEGEIARTAGQLRHFADLVLEGSPFDLRIDHADRTGPELRSRSVGIGPVAVFAASNFPLAFSVAGGDTASALAAGCPVVVKAHEAHLGVSELVAAAVARAVEECELPAGVFSMIVGPGRDVGRALVLNEHIRAVGFTGSQAAGLAIARAAADRTEPIQVFAEMSSVNPCFLLPNALRERAEEIATDFVNSLTLGAGQFCTNPGLLVLEDGVDAERFLEAARHALLKLAAQPMLSSRIHRAFEADAQARATNPELIPLAVAPPGDASGPNDVAGCIFGTDADTFVARPEFQDEVFGPLALVVRCRDTRDFERVAEVMTGQLTASLHVGNGDEDAARLLVPKLESFAGRVIFDGWPTGVRVSDAMVHGGPFPATSAASTTSVGSRAVNRFLRPVCYQGFPEWALPESLREANVERFPHRLNGVSQAGSEESV